MKTRPISLTLSPYSYAVLKALADENDRSLSYMACLAIQRYAEGDEIPGSGLHFDLLKELKAEYGVDQKETR